ncbi:MAG: hypothetical protein JW881_02770 [Spirochaetales bacterium]|nr:hypothetical protein [Spirochaetales bacterium]
MSISKYLDTQTIHDIVKYNRKQDYSKGNVSFTGAPRKHPYDPKKLLLVSDPFSSNTIFFEFNLKDITHLEELSQIASEKGDILKLIKIWVKKGSLGVRYEPFIVEDTLNYLKDTEVLLQRENKGT